MENYIYCSVLVIFFAFIVVRAFEYKSYVISGKLRTHIVLMFFVVVLCLLVAYRPLTISDAMPYYNRYYIEPNQTTLNDILFASSFYRGTGYSMSKPVNLLFFLFYNMHIPYQMFVLTISIIEIALFLTYTYKILKEMDISLNAYTLLVLCMLFYSTRYQFIAFAQGMAMCFGMPILYYVMKKKYVRALILTVIASSFHIAALYFAVIAVIYFFTIRMKNKTYALIWIFSGLFEFTSIGYRLGGTVSEFADFVIKKIVSSNPLYEAYSNIDDSFTISLANLLFWLLCGVLIMVHCDHELYWKLININLISILVSSIFSQWGIVHRFTDISRMFIPLIVIMYLFDTKPVIVFPNRTNKLVTLTAIFGFGFMHSLSLWGFL